MFKIAVLLSTLALAAAYPPVLATSGYLSGVQTVVSSPIVSAYGAGPALVSRPLVSAYSTGSVVSAYGASPVVSTYAAAPVVSSYAAPVAVAASPLALDRHTPATILNQVGRPLDTVDVVNARALHYQAKALTAHGIQKRSLAYSAPLAYSSVVAPVAVSSQSRIDIPSRPVVSLVSAPVVRSYATPVISSYASPLVRSYSAPVVASYASPALVSPVRSYSLY